MYVYRKEGLMIINGLQKLTLLDYPEKVACTIFTGGCNFRCPFCHNASLVTHLEDAERIPEEEVFAFLRKRSGILDGVCITGGEPLLQKDLESFIRSIKALGFSVKLDTNGSFPELLKHLAEEGLVDYVAMDLKNSKQKYASTVGIPGFDLAPIEESVSFLMEGKTPYEFRTTVVREFHQKDDFTEIGKWIQGASAYYLQQFEDSGDLIRPGLHAYDGKVLRQAAGIMEKYVKSVKLRGID